MEPKPPPVPKRLFPITEGTGLPSKASQTAPVGSLREAIRLAKQGDAQRSSDPLTSPTSKPTRSTSNPALDVAPLKSLPISDHTSPKLTSKVVHSPRHERRHRPTKTAYNLTESRAVCLHFQALVLK